MTELNFVNSLRKGLGRCVLALNTPESLLRYKKIVLNCCLRSISRYTDIEKSRGAFLYTVVKKFKDDDYFLDPVIAAYKKLEVGDGLSDVIMLQMTDFLWCFSNENNNKAYETLKNKYLEIKSILCTSSPDINVIKVFEMMSHSFIENDGFGGYMRAIQAVDSICMANMEFTHKDFEDILRAGCNTYQHRRILKEVSLYASRKMHMYFYRFFQMREIPETKAPARRSIKVLPDLNEVCLSVTEIIQQDRQSDEEYILDVCKKIITLHEVKYEKRIPKDLLIFVYENSPSAFFRARAVHFMGKKKMITPELAKECLYDCDDYIRKYIKQYHNHILS